jgi:cell division inhibitor SulA
MNPILEHLKNKNLLWQGQQRILQSDANSTGFSDLDEQLQGGFPDQGVVDIHSPFGIGELRLLCPTLVLRQQRYDESLLIFIAPPLTINSEMLGEFGLNLEHTVVIQTSSVHEVLWSTEQCLKSGCCHTVLVWQQGLEIAQVKRLQLAAEKGQCVLFMLRQSKADSLPLPVTLALKLTPHARGLNSQITKRKGGWPSGPFIIPMQQYWPELSIADSAQILHFEHPHSHVG